MHDVIEHVPDVEALLEEVLRVLCPSGRVIIVSPNLLSPIKPLRHIIGKEGLNVEFYGSYGKALLAVPFNLFLIFSKMIVQKPHFSYREPILDNFQCPDDDAVYMSNFIDLRKWFNDKGFFTYYQQFKPSNKSSSDKLKSKILYYFPWLDKGFCMVAYKNRRS
jgi:SAM-dependent methyltransferase